MRSRLLRLLRPALAVVVLGSLAAAAEASDTVTLWGNYWKERSTRVIEPLVRITKDLPADAEIEVTYLVDNVTSASGAFTATDKPFSKYRQEVRVGLRKQFFGLLTPGVLVRYSDEPDYTSIGYGGNLRLSLDKDLTVIRGYVRQQDDDVRQRERPGFHDTLKTTLIGASLTQVFRPELLGGLTVDQQLLRGYQANPHLNENNPRVRDRTAIAGWLAYRIEPTETTLRVQYRFYFDNWDLKSHTLEIEVTQALYDDVDLIPMFRWYKQSGVYFNTLTGGFVSTDPKLSPFDSQLYGLRVSWRQHWLRGTPLEVFETSTLEPSYALFDQHNSYGLAHIVQLGWSWPF